MVSSWADKSFSLAGSNQISMSYQFWMQCIRVCQWLATGWQSDQVNVYRHVKCTAAPLAGHVTRVMILSTEMMVRQLLGLRCIGDVALVYLGMCTLLVYQG